MAKKTYYYARVSSKNQNLERQIEAFKNLGADERDIICEKESGKTMDREMYNMLKYQLLRPGDMLIITSLDRLGRNKKNIKEELEYYKANNIRVQILDLPTTQIKVPQGQEWIIDMVNNILIEVLAAQSEQERIIIRERQRAGIEIAKKQGKYKGRKKKKIDETLFLFLLTEYQKRKINKVEFAKQLGVSRPTLNKLLNEKSDYEKGDS